MSHKHPVYVPPGPHKIFTKLLESDSDSETLKPQHICLGCRVSDSESDSEQSPPLSPQPAQPLKFFFSALLTDSDEYESDSAESLLTGKLFIFPSTSSSHVVSPPVIAPKDPTDPPHLSSSSSHQLLEHSDSAETQDPNAEQLASLNDTCSTLFPFDFTLPPTKPRLRFRMSIPPPDPSNMPVKLPFVRTIYPHNDEEEEESSSRSSSYIPTPPATFPDDSTSSD